MDRSINRRAERLAVANSSHISPNFAAKGLFGVASQEKGPNGECHPGLILLLTRACEFSG
jgi:hypothetical protein